MEKVECRNHHFVFLFHMKVDFFGASAATRIAERIGRRRGDQSSSDDGD